MRNSSVVSLIFCLFLFSCTAKEQKDAPTQNEIEVEVETRVWENSIRNDTISFPFQVYDKVVAYSMQKTYLIGHDKKFPPSLNGYGFIDNNLNIISSEVNRRILKEIEIKQLFGALHASGVGSSVATLCVPANRDAILFYKKDKPVAAIAICFECHKIYFIPKAGFAVGDVGWAQLDAFFEKLRIQGYKQDKTLK